MSESDSRYNPLAPLGLVYESGRWMHRWCFQHAQDQFKGVLLQVEAVCEDREQSLAFAKELWDWAEFIERTASMPKADKSP